MAFRWTLQDEYDWYIQQAEDPNNSENDRALWRRMAQELATRLPDDPAADTESIF